MADEHHQLDSYTTKDALDHSWKWFEMHASQRMTLFNFFFVAMAFLTAAYVTALDAGYFGVSGAIAVVGLIFGISFRRLDLRTRTLIKIGETALRDLEGDMSNKVGLQSIRLIEYADASSGTFSSYHRVMKILHWLAIVASTTGFIYSLIEIKDH